MFSQRDATRPHLQQQSLGGGGENLQIAAFAYNTTLHSATYYLPFYLVYNKRPHLPIDLTLQSGCTEAYGNYNDYCRSMETKWAKKLALLQNGIEKERYKQYFDRKVNAVPFKVGDRVMRQAPYKSAVVGKRITKGIANGVTGSISKEFENSKA